MAIVNGDNGVVKKTSKGKQKIEIKKIEKKSARQVAFSKRRQGLIKKCSKLCNDDTGSEYALITFSIAGKPYVSGYPSVDAVIKRYLNHTRKNDVEEGSTLTSTSTSSLSSNANWLETLIDGTGLDELDGVEIALEGLRNEVASRIREINRANDSNLGVQETNPANNSNLGVQEINGVKEITIFGHTIKVGGINEASNCSNDSGCTDVTDTDEIGESHSTKLMM